MQATVLLRFYFIQNTFNLLTKYALFGTAIAIT